MGWKLCVCGGGGGGGGINFSGLWSLGFQIER